ncbi:predicted protein [Sclerotinia sclerotiorum 1980 UF-70]|uniref:Uncharacterized protein n=1 Tax=Sclerotinia sclerotiorum (strain ATCC 18683 / 1980 / Ss-1) TaxID=665079 RepID=A7EN22_SCLS1|nr:predicted protein [Sclerotinia sclerotiorum 1980 UF-70]EDO04238.1 predicted protein [Sclerotinia sclerotiorum 1980 UF-70]
MDAQAALGYKMKDFHMAGDVRRRRLNMNNMGTISVLQGEICVSSKVDSERTQRIFGFIRAKSVEVNEKK